jgi:hypothetical protein
LVTMPSITAARFASTARSESAFLSGTAGAANAVAAENVSAIATACAIIVFLMDLPLWLSVQSSTAQSGALVNGACTAKSRPVTTGSWVAARRRAAVSQFFPMRVKVGPGRPVLPRTSAAPRSTAAFDARASATAGHIRAVHRHSRLSEVGIRRRHRANTGSAKLRAFDP